MICNEPTIKDKQLYIYIMIPNDSYFTKPSWLVMKQSSSAYHDAHSIFCELQWAAINISR